MRTLAVFIVTVALCGTVQAHWNESVKTINGQYLYGSSDMTLSRVKTLDGCVAELLNNPGLFYAVSFSGSSCIAAATPNYTFGTGDYRWTTYTVIEKVAPIQGLAIFTRSSQFTVPENVNTLKVLLVGAGAGGSSCDGGGGGSGYVVFGEVHVTPGRTYPVTVGWGGSPNGNNGCKAGKTGGSTSFAGLTAAGGQSAFHSGGNGGSGGGCGLYDTVNYWVIANVPAGVGGSAGSDGGATSFGPGGVGQHYDIGAITSTFTKMKISAGAGAPPQIGSKSCDVGGSGAGGILLNNDGPLAKFPSCMGQCQLEAEGYGAGGGGGMLCNSGSYNGGAYGAQGLLYIEY